MTEEDVALMVEAIWNGTKNLITGSKFGQMPRLLMQVIYKENQNFHIGELDKRISIVSDKNDEAIRSITDLKVDITNLIKALSDHKDKIEKIRLKVDERVCLIKDGDICDINNVLTGFSVEALNF